MPKLTLVSTRATNKEYQTTKKSNGTCLNNLKRYLVEYCEATTVHGVKYVGERGRYFVEKVVWVVIILLLCTFCLRCTYKTYSKWMKSPVVVTFATKETPIYKIPFPAVTICPEVKFDPEVFNFTDMVIRNRRGENFTKQEQEDLQLAYLICDNNHFDTSTWNLTISPNVIMNNVFKRAAFGSLHTTFKWMGKNVDMNNFTDTYTTEGFCHTFNMLPYDEILRHNRQYTNISKNTTKIHKWSLARGYLSGDLDAFPRRTFMNGLEGGLEITVLYTNNSHLDYLCKDSLQGFKVVLHTPNQLPNMEKHFRLPLNQAVLVGIKPSLVTMSSDLLNYPPKKRKCYLPNEKPLISFKNYTRQNCLDECLANYTLARCGCVPLYLPLLYSNSSSCGPGSNECVKESKMKYLEIESNSSSESQQCECLPSCTFIRYDIETSQAKWNVKKMFSLLPNNDSNHTRDHFSKLNVYYKDLQFLAYERNGLFCIVDFISKMGGLLGLFIGFSVTSAIEIVYFCTLRIICNYNKIH